MRLQVWCLRGLRSGLAALLAASLGLGAAVAGSGGPVYAQPLQSIPVVVVNVLAADRLEVAMRDGRLDTVRLRSVDVPSCTERDALSLTSTLTLNETAYLELSAQGRGPDGDLLGYVWVNDGMLNVILASQGLAVLAGAPGRYQRTLADAVDDARARGRGGWGSGCLP